MHFYRLQTKFAKVMFLQVSVCPHWGGCAWFYLGGHAWFYSEGMHGFIRGVHGFIRGAWVVLLGGHAWFYSGACVVLFGGRVWFYWGDMRGFIWGACMVLFRGACMVLFRGGMCGFIQGGCMRVLFGGHAWFYLGGSAWFFQFFRIQWDTVNERAVRILLECILVVMKFRNVSESIQEKLKCWFYNLLWSSCHEGIHGHNNNNNNNNNVCTYNHQRGHSIFWWEQRWASSVDQSTITYCNILQHSSSYLVFNKVYFLNLFSVKYC